ncbi:MAG: hypothetical protein CR975_06295 [Gammaproteobacteria bacterium]|nr:MAG: hypothetical protein CR975_06295 [Gammaproteobacteria bacterium]
MSQILDAINKAEKQRQDALETQQVSRETLYHSLNPNKNNKKRGQRLPFMLLAIGCLAAVAYWVYYHQWRSATVGNKTVQRATAAPSTPLAAQTNTTASNNMTNTESKAAKINPTLTPASTTIPDSAADKATAQADTANKQSAISTSSQPAGVANIKGKKPPALAALTPMAKRPTAIPQQLSQLKPIAKAPVAAKTAALRPALQSLPAEQPSKAAKATRATAKTTTSAPTAPALVKTAVTSANNAPQSGSTPSWKKNIRITAIMYHQQAAKRFVLINGKKIYEGGQIPDSQTTVVKILPKNIIVNDGSGDIMIR